MNTFGTHSMVAPLRRVIVKRPQEAFRNHAKISSEWQKLHFTGRPDLSRAVSEHEQFLSLFDDCEILRLPVDERTTLDSLYPRDVGLITIYGAVLFQPGKTARRGEELALADALKQWQIPLLGSICGEGCAEGGDMAWLDHQTLVVGRGFRTNQNGILQLTQLLNTYSITVVAFDLPCWQGAEDVLHLMSLLSPVDVDLAVIYRPLLPAPLFQMLIQRGVQFVEVPDGEFESQGCNVLALAPRDVVMLDGNPITRRRLEQAGCRVRVCEGSEISLKGCGGPTCLTLPVSRLS